MTKKKEKYPPVTTMSLGDHLEELRARLILAILGLVVGTVVCLFFGRKIIRLIEEPYYRVMRSHASLKIQEAQTGYTYLFEVFYSKDADTREREKAGRGLGLAICKEIVRAHKGVIWAESAGVGKGSTFVVMLPIKSKSEL